jgi:ATP-dependent helicase/nuclease subunit A
MVKPLDKLKDEQLYASDPRQDVWLSASAGTGKTHVLTARVYRLLLRRNFDPSTLLCLTFTKAGAAEMADRIHARLAHWVRLDDATLRKELFSLGEPNDDATVARARTLFARVLDTHGGLRIQTIHAFCQQLLAGFPIEAGLVPGFRALEGREEARLARTVLADMVLDAEATGNDRLIAALQALSRRLGEGGAEAFLKNCARAPDVMASLPVDIAPFVRRALDLPPGDIEQAIAAECGDDRFDVAGLRRMAAACAAWGTATGLGHADRIAAFLNADAVGRAALVADLGGIAFTGKGELRAFAAGLIKAEPDYAALAAALGDCCARLAGWRSVAVLADLFAAGLDAGRTYARAYAEAKRAAGVVEFDDLIRATVALLAQPGIGDWIRYKLDQATDHILVDEAQDTNAAQWSIVGALAGEFFVGDGARGDRLRTIFSVGDFKQAIFGFQGTDPVYFEAAQIRFAGLAEAAGARLLDLSLARSFRSTPPVLDVVDAVIAHIGAAAMGLENAEPHVSAIGGPGTVTLLKPVAVGAVEGDDEGEEGWIDDAVRALATRIARQIRVWLDAPMWLESKGRPLAPEDILILVRRRGDLASLIVARLYAEKVPVAGVDRLRLNTPLVVRDLLAAARFALQPDDDLNLAALLVSPLIGWSQEELLAHAPRPDHVSLWRQVRDLPAAAPLRAILGQADLSTPYRFFEHLLSGPLDGRRKLLRRLGREARDPIDELLNAALQFESDATPSLQLFLDWFDRGDVEIVRDPSKPQASVRVMTVHGAKGLQAPLVILADATTDPRNARRDRIDWQVDGIDGAIPVFRPRKDELAGSLRASAEQADARDLQEHWRLLYVAMTRAEERLVIGGALGTRVKGVPPQASWYAAIDQVLAAMGAEQEPDTIWDHVRTYRGVTPVAATRRRSPPPSIVLDAVAVPDWATRPAPQEARPPRPLAPSSIGPDAVSDPPPGPAMRAAAERGRRLHALFERLPGIAADQRAAAGDRWLNLSEGVRDDAERRALVDAACAIIASPAYADLFGPDALAEAPIAAVVGGDVIAGTVDRLLVTPAAVKVVDFKTGRRAPASLDRVPDHHLRQMAAYVAALEVIFPDRPVSAALLYTAAPVLFDLPAALVAAYKPGLAAAQQNSSIGD